MASINSTISNINLAKTNLAESLITKFGVLRQDTTIDGETVPGLYNSDGDIHRLADWVVAVNGTSVGSALDWYSEDDTSATIDAPEEIFFIAGAGDGNTGTLLLLNPLAITANKDITAPAYYTDSDASLKTNIEKISDSIYSFNWKNSGEKSYGFIAQELEKENPELVTDTTDHKVVNYDAALSLTIAKLENRIKELEKEVEILKHK